MDYINYVKESPMMGQIGLGGGATSLGRYGSAAGADAFRGDRAIMGFANKYPSDPRTSTIYYWNIASTGNSSYFGALTQARANGASTSGGGGADDSTRSVFGSGYNASPGSSNVLDYVTIANTGNASDFGDLNYESANPGGACSNGARGIFANGFGSASTYAPTGRIDYFEIATTGNASDFGDYGNQAGTYGQYWGSACGSDKGRGLIGGTGGPTHKYIWYVQIDTAANANGFGYLTQQRNPTAACGDGERGTWWGNGSYGTIDYVTMATTGNATDFGDMEVNVDYQGGCSNDTRGTIAGGQNDDGFKNNIQYVTIANTGNASAFGTIGAQRLMGNGGSGD
jgi:hypothetical protein